MRDPFDLPCTRVAVQRVDLGLKRITGKRGHVDNHDLLPLQLFHEDFFDFGFQPGPWPQQDDKLSVKAFAVAPTGLTKNSCGRDGCIVLGCRSKPPGGYEFSEGRRESPDKRKEVASEV